MISSITSIAEDFISFLRFRYNDLTINTGNAHSYLGMNLEFRERGVKVTMDNHINDVVSIYIVI